MVDGRTTREARDDDPDDDFVYLPQSDGIRPCYYRYMKEVGYKCKSLHNGTLQIKPIDKEGVQQPYVCLPTYYAICQRDYPQLKGSRAAEDLCNLCCKFANRHHYLAKNNTMSGNTANVHLDNDLFCDDSDDDEDDDTEGDCPPLVPKGSLLPCHHIRRCQSRHGRGHCLDGR